MPNTCGLAVYSLWASSGIVFRLTHRSLNSQNAWVQSYGFLRSLYQLCTQVLHWCFGNSMSVISKFYPLSTQPIKTTTLKMKGT